MADGYNAQEMTAHYISLAQSDPQKYQLLRDKIKEDYENWYKHRGYTLKEVIDEDGKETTRDVKIKKMNTRRPLRITWTTGLPGSKRRQS